MNCPCSGPMVSNNWVFTMEELRSNTPSRADGYSWEMEKATRHNSCIFILEIGRHLRRDNRDNTAFIRDSAACILFHRFFTVQSFKSHNRLIVGAACLFLAGKIEGCFRHISEIVRIYCKVRGIVKDKESPSEADMKEQQEMILIAERLILHTLCFDMHIEHHFKPLAWKLKTDLKMYIPEDSRVDVMNSAFCFMRDSFGTVLCLLYPAELRAAGALFLAILQLGISPQPQHSLQKHRRLNSAEESLGKSWYELFQNDIGENDLRNICSQIIEVYESKNWKPKSEAKTAPDISKLKSHLSCFFEDSSNQVSIHNNFGEGSTSNSQTNRKNVHETQRPRIENVEKIETIVEKNRKNSPTQYVNLEKLSSSATDSLSVPSNGIARPPPTPDYLPPPPTNAPDTKTSGVTTTVPINLPPVGFSPPTPDLILPPPMPPATTTPNPIPTPENILPPPMPPQERIETSHSGGLDNGSTGGKSIRTDSTTLNCKRGLEDGCDVGKTFFTNGYTSNGSISNDSLGSPPNYCSPPYGDNVSPKRARHCYK